MTAQQYIHKIVIKEARRAKRPEIYVKNRAEYLWEIYWAEGFAGLVEATLH
jgi:hypothetical protein